MGRTTLLDAFDAAAGLTQQVLGNETEKMRERNNLELKVFEAELATNVENFIRDNPYVGGNNEEDDEKSYNDYQGKINTYIEEQYKNARNRNTSPYYGHMLDQMKTQSLGAMRNYTLEKQDEWRIQRENISNAEDIKNYISAGWEPQQTLTAIYNRINLSAKRRQLDPQRINDMRQAAERAVYEQYALDNIGKVTDVNNLDAAMDDIRKAFDFMPSTALNTYDGEGNITGVEEKPWGFEGREGWEKALLEKETKRIHGERFDFFQEKQSFIDRLIISGDLDEAINLCNIYGAQWNKYYNPNNPEFANSNEGYRNRGSGFFNVGKLEEYKKQGTIGKAISLLEAYGPEMFIQPQLGGGNGTVIVGHLEDGTPITERYDSIQEAMEGFFHYYGQAFLAANGGENAFTLQLWESEKAEWMEKFYDETRKALQQLDPTLAADFIDFRKFDTYLTNGNDYFNNAVNNMSQQEKDQYAQRCVDFFHSIFYNGITNAPTIRQMMRDFTGQEITNFLQWSSTPNDEAQKTIQLKNFSDKAMSGGAEDILFVKHVPHRLDLGLNASDEEPESSYVWRDEKQQEAAKNVMEEERKRLAILLNTSVENLKPHWMPSERRKGDVIPKGMFVIEGEEKDETYFLDYDENANFIVRKQNLEGKWEEYVKVERPLTEQEKASARAEVIQNYRASLNQTIPIHPITGEEFNYKTAAPPDYTGSFSLWNGENGNDSSKRNSWAVYLQRLTENPDSTIRQALDAGKNPLTGAALDYQNVPIPGFNGSTGAWQGITIAERKNIWTNHFKQQVK